MKPHQPPSDADIDRQERMRQARDEFNETWNKCKIPLARFYGTSMNKIELLAWEFFLRGKGLKQ